MRRTALLVVLALCLTIVAGGPATAFHEDWETLPLVYETALDGPHYVALEVDVAPTSDGEQVDLVFLGDDLATEGQWLLDATHVMFDDGGWWAGFGGSGCGSFTEVTLFVSSGDDEPIVDRSNAPACGGSGGQGWYLPPGRATIVHIVGSDGEFSGGLRVRAAENVSVLGLTSGPAFDAADADFGGDLNAHTRTVAVEGQVIVGGSVEQTIEHSLFGWFTSDGPTLRRTEGPDGWDEKWGGIYMGEPAGDYTFAVDAKADVDVIFWTRVWLLGADVRLPFADSEQVF